MERGNDIAHKQNSDTNKAMDKIDRKDEKYIKRQEKKNRRGLYDICLVHAFNCFFFKYDKRTEFVCSPPCTYLIFQKDITHHYRNCPR